MAELDPNDAQQRLKSFDLLKRMLSTYDFSKVDATMSPTETMVGHNYFWVGASAMEAIIASVQASQLTEVRTILDMPCGHGRVLRHLAAMFPDATIDACDLDKEGVEFCAKAFGARPIVSHEDLTAVEFDTKYDLIWIGSLFTHTSRDITEKWLTFLSRQLTSEGIIVATFHGRFAPKLHYHTPYIDDDKWAVIMDGYLRTGYGYADYQSGQSHDFIEGSYGLSVTRPSTLLEIVFKIPGVRVHHYKERGWGNNHDIIAFGPPDWDDSTWPSEEPKLIPPPPEPPDT
ncbi:hypothetical protein PMI09_00583 [Rhizobium sp. CF122]|uniref:class I SAM-dependent methyltransferase n=1 Tax=Rhizobium sp. CF122 TaxID=1144312 RepID=UPI0002718EAE|nr:class I SAM-dependent methyltransferase [Rhizobium sp. CF122]EJL58090.1 hypothetical protein PMI09_00583 [Rhizobium sp. CF122]